MQVKKNKFKLDPCRFRVARALKGWTLLKLEEISGVRRKTIAMIEKGQTKNVRMSTFKKLMDALEQDITFFRADTDLDKVI